MPGIQSDSEFKRALSSREADWLKQAGHFVAAAAAGCLAPADQQCGELAWSVWLTPDRTAQITIVLG